MSKTFRVTAVYNVTAIIEAESKDDAQDKFESSFEDYQITSEDFAHYEVEEE